MTATFAFVLLTAALDIQAFFLFPKATEALVLGGRFMALTFVSKYCNFTSWMIER